MEIQNLKIIAYAISLAISFTAGWTVNGWRHDLELKEVKISHAKILEASAMDSLNAYKHMELVKDEAIKSAEERATKNAANAKLALDSVDRLRGDLAKVPARISAASRSAVDRYAATASELLGTCAAEYQRMAEAADRHSSDVRLMLDSWPSNAPAQTEK